MLETQLFVIILVEMILITKEILVLFMDLM